MKSSSHPYHFIRYMDEEKKEIAAAAKRANMTLSQFFISSALVMARDLREKGYVIVPASDSRAA